MIGVVLVICLIFLLFFSDLQPPHRKAGQRGERIVTKVLKQHLDENDKLLTNCSIIYDGRHAELDNVIINRYGVLIVEVKNYSGKLYGNEEDYEWEKRKITDAGNVYIKHVKNPIKQIKRQIFLLAKYLQDYGVDVWVEGYVILLKNNSPIENEHILSTNDNLYVTFHTKNRQFLETNRIEKIYGILYEKSYQEKEVK